MEMNRLALLLLLLVSTTLANSPNSDFDSDDMMDGNETPDSMPEESTDPESDVNGSPDEQPEEGYSTTPSEADLG